MKLLITLMLTLMAGCGNSVKVYTLYRNSEVLISARIHVATFDSKDETLNYNFNNCDNVRKLLQKESNLFFWCEQGFYND